MVADGGRPYGGGFRPGKSGSAQSLLLVGVDSTRPGRGSRGRSAPRRIPAHACRRGGPPLQTGLGALRLLLPPSVGKPVLVLVAAGAGHERSRFAPRLSPGVAHGA